MTADGQRLPYPGLRPFRRDESDLFFGRDGCVDAMVDRLAATRFLAVLGASGSGKSSLVHTGLLEALEIGLLAGAGARWVIASMRPGSQPTANLARALLAAARPPGGSGEIAPLDAEVLASYLRRGPRSVASWCRDGNLPPRTNLLLLVDQFEELFRYGDYAGREAAERFVALLLESARTPDVPIYAAVTMRSEYLGACALIPGLAERINAGLYLTPRMSREETREAITGPAAVCGFRLEPGLVNQLLNDLSSLAPWEDDRDSDQLQRLSRRADQLPLMQHVLNRMWLRAEAAGGPVTLTAEDYARVGGLTGALEAHAREVLDGLPAEDRPVVETVFRALVTGASVADAVRRPCRLGEIAALAGEGRADAVARVVDAFRDPGCNFLVPPPPAPLAPGTILDISHESLIRQWPQLSEWLQAEAKAAATWRRLSAAAASHASGEGDLLRGLDLANLAAWWRNEQPSPAWAERYGGGWDAAQRFLEASEAAEQAVKEKERRRRRRAVVALSGAVALLLLTLIGGSAAYVELKQQRNEIAEQKSIADNSRNAALSLLGSVVQDVSKDEYFAQVGALGSQARLLQEIQSHFNMMKPSLRADDAGLQLSQAHARFLLGRLTNRVAGSSEALKVLAPLFAELAQRAAARDATDADRFEFVRTGALLAQVRSRLNDKPGALQALDQIERALPDPNANLNAASPDALDAYLWVSPVRYTLEVTEAEARRLLAEQMVAAANRLLELRPGQADALHTAYIAFGDLGAALRTLGRNEEAEETFSRGVQVAREAHRRIPGSLIYIAAYAEALNDLTESLENRNALTEARSLAEETYDLLRPALAISPDEADLNVLASKALDHLSSILTKQDDPEGAAAHRITSLAIMRRRLTADPLDRALAGDALLTITNAMWIFERAAPSAQQVQQCLDVASQALTLSQRYPAVPEHASLAAAATACAMDVEKRLAAPASGEAARERPAENFILAHADELSSLLSAAAVDPDADGDFHDRMASLLRRASDLLAERGELARAGAYQTAVIAALKPLHPRLDYNLYAMQHFSDAYRLIGDYRRRQGDTEQAARHYRVCADPDQVPYPSQACMENLARMIETGELGGGHEQEALALRDRIPLYALKRFTVPIRSDSRTILFPVYVTTPPRGFEGIDNQVQWLKRVRGLDIPAGIAESFRRLDRVARENKVPFPDLAVYVWGKPGSEQDAAELTAIEDKFRSGDHAAALGKAEEFYSNTQKYADFEGERRALLVSKLAALAAESLRAKDPDTAAMTFTRTSGMIGADARTGPTRLRLAWAEFVEQMVVAFRSADPKVLRPLAQGVVALRRDVLTRDPVNAGSKAPLASDLEIAADLAYNDKDYAEAATTAADAVATYRTLLADEAKGTTTEAAAEVAALVSGLPTEKPARVRALQAGLADALTLLGRALRQTGQEDAAAPNLAEAVTIRRDLAAARSCDMKGTDDYVSTLSSFVEAADEARDWNTALSGSRELVGALRTGTACDAARRPLLASALNEVSWFALFTRDWASARAAADEGSALDPARRLILETNGAHARMLGGDVEAARALYLANVGKQVGEQGRWEDVVAADFRLLRAAGIEHPLMAEVEAAFKARTSREATAPEP